MQRTEADELGTVAGTPAGPILPPLHSINLFVWPSNTEAIREEQQLVRQGYNLVHWTQSGMTYWLISDLNLTELSECARLPKE